MKCTVIIPAGGQGKRFGSDIPKQFTDLAGKPIIAHTLSAFEKVDEITSIVIPVHSEWYSTTQKIIEEYNITKAQEIVIAGKKRQESIFNALHSKSVEDADIVLVHDAVRPLVSDKLIKKVIESAEEFGAAIPALEITEIIKEKTSNGSVVKTLDKNKLCRVQTPQGFWQELIVTAYTKANEVAYIGPDSSSLLEFIGYKVQLVEGESSNIKIVNKLDMRIAEMLINGK